MQNDKLIKIVLTISGNEDTLRASTEYLEETLEEYFLQNREEILNTEIYEIEKNTVL